VTFWVIWERTAKAATMVLLGEVKRRFVPMCRVVLRDVIMLEYFSARFDIRRYASTNESMLTHKHPRPHVALLLY